MKKNKTKLEPSGREMQLWIQLNSYKSKNPTSLCMCSKSKLCYSKTNFRDRERERFSLQEHTTKCLLRNISYLTYNFLNLFYKLK